MNPCRVFLSHTSEFRAYPAGRSYVDLAERAVMAAGHLVVDMKDFPSIDEAPADVCIQRVKSCDVYLGLLGTRWGTPVKGQPEVSYTELEFDTASQQQGPGKKIQRLIFVLDDEAVDTGIPPKALIDLDNPGQQERFLQKVRESGLTYQVFSNPDQLSQLIERSLNELSVRPEPGQRSISLADLDAWVERNLPNLERSFLGIPSVQQRRVHVPLDVRITYSASGEQTPPQILHPNMLTSVITSPMSETLLINGDGGTGKTSLAFMIASWLLHGEPGGTPRIPVLIETALAEGETVLGRMGQWIKAQISGNGEDGSPELVEALMRHKRMVLLVDHVSELPKAARQRLLSNLPAGLVIATSRSFDDGWQERPLTRIEPLQIATDRLQSFFIDYLRRKAQEDVLNDEDLIPAQNQLRLIVGDKPITALLAHMFIDDVVAKKQQGVLAGSVPELMLSYIKRMDTPSDETMRTREGLTIDTELVQRTLKVLALASHRQGPAGKPRYQPLVFPVWLADRALAAEEGMALKKAEQRQALLNYCLELNLLNHPGMDTGEFCFPLDPLADYLAALCQLEQLEVQCQTNADAWDDFLRQLEQRPEDERQLMRGFLLAFRDCCQERSFHRVLSMPQDTPDRLGRLAFLNPAEERYRLALQRARKWMWELGVPVESERRDAISRLAAMAATGGNHPEKRAVQQVATERLRLSCRDNGLSESERAEAIVVLGLLGDSDALRLFLDEEEQPVALRRAAAEALGLTLRERLGDKAQRTAHLKQLSARMERERLQVTIRTEEDWRRVDERLPLQQGLARGIQLASAGESCGWVDGPGLAMPMLHLTAFSDDSGLRLHTEVSKIPVWSLPLPNQQFLEVVRIPAGRYRIGSEDGEAERSNYEHAPECTGMDVEQLRTVEVDSFLMGRFPVSQAQWAAVAALPMIHRDLSSSPSSYDANTLWERHATQGQLAVNCVNWDDCQEWLARLNMWLAKHMMKKRIPIPMVSLPSESQWEVACRGGEHSPFAYGDTLDTSWANYLGSFVYGSGRKGSAPKRTTCIGAYGVVNAWGLGEMNGHLFEWCQDVWHPSPAKAPMDGSAQLELDPMLAGNPSQQHRVLRGGSWSNGPRLCRSSFRFSGHPMDNSAIAGFRVVVSATG